MHRNDKIVFGTVIAGYIFVIGLLFAENLPTMCANPQIGSNYILHDIGACK